jgi:hypothetical protein
MAKQVGLVRYSGTMGGVRHFKIKGLQGDFAGMKGGASAEQIKNGEEFVRTRENMNEFGGCAKAGKSVRNGLASILSEMSDSQLTGRLTSIMKKINLEDQSEARGYRAILISEQPQYLLAMQFNRSINFDSVLTAPAVITHDPARNKGNVNFANIEPYNVMAPAGSTHFRIVHTLSVISDFSFNANTSSYEPIDAANNELNDVKFSGYLDLAVAQTNVDIETELPGLPTLSTDVSVLQCVGIEFFQKVGANYYMFSQGNSLKVASIF